MTAKRCIGWGEHKGTCAYSATVQPAFLWCPRCEALRIETITAQQRREAIARANTVRRSQYALKSAIRAHELSIPAALGDPRADALAVESLLLAQYGWGGWRAGKALRLAGQLLWGRGTPPFPGARYVGSLSERERAAIVQACKETGRG
jgi:hypothetical protein